MSHSYNLGKDLFISVGICLPAKFPDRSRDHTCKQASARLGSLQPAAWTHVCTAPWACGWFPSIACAELQGDITSISFPIHIWKTCFLFFIQML